MGWCRHEAVCGHGALREQSSQLPSVRSHQGWSSRESGSHQEPLSRGWQTPLNIITKGRQLSNHSFLLQGSRGFVWVCEGRSFAAEYSMLGQTTRGAFGLHSKKITTGQVNRNDSRKYSPISTFSQFKTPELSVDSASWGRSVQEEEGMFG